LLISYIVLLPKLMYFDIVGFAFSQSSVATDRNKTIKGFA